MYRSTNHVPDVIDKNEQESKWVIIVECYRCGKSKVIHVQPIVPNVLCDGAIWNYKPSRLSSTSCSKNSPLRIIYFSTKWIWVGEDEDSKAGYLWIFWAELSHPNSANGLGWWFGDSWRIPYEKDPILKGVADSNWAKPPIYHHSDWMKPKNMGTFTAIGEL